jgi:hypothetical protein
MNESTTPKGYLSRVRIQVTEQNIKDACKADSRHCMIADAIAAKLPDVRNISVDMMTIRWSDPATGWRYIYLTPKPAQFALVDFDMGLEVQPFTFQLRSGHATPMNLGTGENRRRAHKLRGNQILKVSDKTMVHSVGYDSVPMWPKDTPASKPEGVSHVSRDTIPMGPRKKKSPGRPKEWHPSHHSLRHFGMRGFTEGYIKAPSH